MEAYEWLLESKEERISEEGERVLVEHTYIHTGTGLRLWLRWLNKS